MADVAKMADEGSIPTKLWTKLCSPVAIQNIWNLLRWKEVCIYVYIYIYIFTYIYIYTYTEFGLNQNQNHKSLTHDFGQWRYKFRAPKRPPGSVAGSTTDPLELGETIFQTQSPACSPGTFQVWQPKKIIETWFFSWCIELYRYWNIFLGCI